MDTPVAEGEAGWRGRPRSACGDAPLIPDLERRGGQRTSGNGIRIREAVRGGLRMTGNYCGSTQHCASDRYINSTAVNCDLPGSVCACSTLPIGPLHCQCKFETLCDVLMSAVTDSGRCSCGDHNQCPKSLPFAAITRAHFVTRRDATEGGQSP
jgi:hypothetical protein